MSDGRPYVVFRIPESLGDLGEALGGDNPAKEQASSTTGVRTVPPPWGLAEVPLTNYDEDE